jgi:aminoglycoside phosphotransferase (APT) family kinase protein
MTTVASPAELEPLESASLNRLFPHLREVIDPELMQSHLQQTLFDGSGLTVEMCERPRAELGAGMCSLQFPLFVRTSAQVVEPILVLATMFTDLQQAIGFERTALAPLAARWRPPPGAVPRASAVVAPLNLAVSVFPVAAALPTLVDVVEPRRVEPAVRKLIGDDGAVVTTVELVTIRRTRGCVLRMHLASSRQTVVYAKVGYATASRLAAAAVHSLESRAREEARPAVNIPHVFGRVAALELSLQAMVPGGKPDLRDAAESAVSAAARVAAWLHTSGVDIGTHHTLGDELVRAHESVAQLGAHAPALATWLGQALAAAERMAALVPAAPPVFVHGDFTPSQLMLDGERAGVLDFDKLCQAEPACDLGRFLAYLRFTIAKHGHGSPELLAARFLEAYAANGGQLPDAARLHAYEISSLVRMAARRWLQLKPARLRVACRVLEDCLAEVARTFPGYGFV